MTRHPIHTPNPFPWQKLRSDEVTQFRFLDCPHYSSCLSHAADRAWLSFICTYCPLFSLQEKQLTSHSQGNPNRRYLPSTPKKGEPPS